MLTERKRQQAANHYRKIMQLLNIDVNEEHSKDTPVRVVKMLEEMTASSTRKPDLKLTTFKNKGDQLIIVTPIPMSSLCAHHHVPFIGNAAVGYLPDKLMVGISKWKRVIDFFSARPCTQEILTNDVADYLYEELKPRALYVYMEATHACMGARGVRTPCSATITHAVRGPKGFDNVIKSEFIALATRKMP